MNINKLSLDEKIGQRFILGINNSNIESIINLIKKYKIGGVILYKKNYSSYYEMLDVIKKLKMANKDNSIPLFIAIDQEGGRVNRISTEIHNLKNIYDVSKRNSSYVSDYANIIGNILYKSGINMNLAPVIDIYNNSNSKVLDKRCFYGDYLDVSKNGDEYIKQLTNNKVISVVKHFPGHGVSKIDSHFVIPYVINYNEILDKHIKPFENAIMNKVPVIMVGHLVIRKLTKMLPASISSDFIKKYLREKYDGIIMTDELNMLKRHLLYKFNYLKNAFKSDNDILLIKIRDEKEGCKIIKNYKKFLSNNYDYVGLLDRSVERIINVKDKFKINDDVNYDGIDVEIINKAIDDINDKVKIV